ncbi:MAG TPA: hypothetical protein VGN55_22010 [Xanthobacteraceae bacterium]|jgi:hypothetical protein
MFCRSASAAIALAALCIAGTGAPAQNASKSDPSKDEASRYDPSRYPDWSGPMRWIAAVGGGNRYDPSKPTGRGQQAPLTPEYQAKFEAGLKDQATGGQGANQTYSCLPGGMPRDMAGNQGLEFVVTPKVTHVLFIQAVPRRIYTDGRDWPENEDPSFYGYSIGKWSEPDQDGRYSLLKVETRNFNGPRSFDNAGIPLHVDNQTVIKERIYRDKQNAEIIHDEMTTFDHALTHPWTVDKTYRLQKNPHWVQNICSVGNMHVQIGKEAYFLSADGLLMPVRKDQPPPDLRYFKQSRN